MMSANTRTLLGTEEARLPLPPTFRTMSRCYGKFAAFLQLGSWVTVGVLDTTKPLGSVQEGTFRANLVVASPDTFAATFGDARTLGDWMGANI